MPGQNTKRPTSTHHKKRTGDHHRRGKQYHKVYWPYVALLIVTVVGIFAANWQPTTRNGVLAYATEMNIKTLLDATNDQRSKNEKSSLKLNDRLTQAAQAKANDMTSRNYWSHNTPDGKEPWVFVQSANYDYQKAGENLAYGFNSSKDTINGWMNSRSHRENLLDANFTEVGFGFANSKNFNNSGPETVVVAMYGLPSDAPIPVENAESQANNDADSPVTSDNPITESTAQPISRLQTITAGKAPWMTFAVGLTSGILLAWVVLKHGLAVRRLAIEGEEFIVHHPFIDIAFVAIAMTGYFLLQGSGFIK